MERPSGSGAPAPSEDHLVRALTFGEERDAPARARLLVQEAARAAGLAPLADDAVAVVTELVTNAILHGTVPGELVVRGDAGDGALRLEVFDTSPVVPVRARENPEAMTGRGLALVEALSDRWGVQRSTGGKVVWADIRNGTHKQAAADVDPEELLAQWPDLEPEDDGGPRQAEPRYTVQLGDVPTDLLLAAKAHVDNLVREFSLAAAGARAGMTPAVPTHLAELIDAVVHGFAAPRDAIKRQALSAAHAGQDHVRLELHLPVGAADAGVAYLRALDEADDYCRAARLLTLESPPQHRVFRRWYVEELIGQLRGATGGGPLAPAETFEQRLLREIDRVAAAERRAERSARLHALSSALASAITPEAVTQAVLTEGVAALRASGGAILLASDSSTLALPGAVGYREQIVAKLRGEPADAELPAAMALRSGEAVWLESREERDARFPSLAGLEPETVAMCAVPLAIGERRLGAMRFSFSEARLFDESERAFMEAMAALTAQALDRAQLYTQRIEVSRRLQRSLLPPSLPDVPGVRIEASYQPLGDGVDVGGDFFDVWPCGPGRWGVAIGDASGTGPEAAAMTALVRHTLRALTLNDMHLETVLHQLNRALRDARTGTEDDRFCTVLLGFLTVGEGKATVELTSGGHPGPLLFRAGGDTEEIDLEGSLLGLLAPADLDRRVLTLEPGDELLLYTDGVTDTRHGNEVFGMERLVATALRARADGGSTVEAVSAAVRAHAGGHMGDDVALLSLRLDGDAASGLESGMGIEPT